MKDAQFLNAAADVAARHVPSRFIAQSQSYICEACSVGEASVEWPCSERILAGTVTEHPTNGLLSAIGSRMFPEKEKKMTNPIEATDGPRRYARRYPACEAWQVVPGNQKQVAAWCGGRPLGASVLVNTGGYEWNAAVGDWIIREGDVFQVVLSSVFAQQFSLLRTVETGPSV